MANVASEITFADRQVLSLLPLVGDKLGPHTLKRSVKALVEDLSFQYTSDEISGFLRGMRELGLTVALDIGKRDAGWQATPAGREAVEAWDSLLVYRLLQIAVKTGEGLAEVRINADANPIAYVASPARYERMADDPSASIAVVITNKEHASV